MNLFSISQLAQFSGVKPHTIRIWEQRYNALKPNRSEGNTRYYDNSQLRRLLNIVSLMESGYRVSELGSMTDENLSELLAKKWNVDDEKEPTEYFISQLIAAGTSYDEGSFEKSLSHCLLRFGMKDAYIKVLYPMLGRIGILWASDKLAPAHEHFISNLVRQKLFTAIDYLPAPNSESDSWLLFLPENEYHEIGLLFAYYLIRLSGRKAVYLGSNVPLKSLISAVHQTKPSNLLFFLVHNDFPDQIQIFLDELRSGLTNEKIFLTGNPKLISQLQTNTEVHWLKSVEDLKQLLPFVYI